MQKTGTRRGRDGLLVASGAALMLVTLLVLQSLLGIGPFTRTITTYNPTYGHVSDAYASHLARLSERNLTAVMGDYESNATVDWVGVPFHGVSPGSGISSGAYTGSKNISILLAILLGKFNGNFSLSSERQSIGQVGGGGAWIVNSTLSIHGYGQCCSSGNQQVVSQANGTLVAQDLYADVNGIWLISRETWNFAQVGLQIPVISA